jgi:hypothetical protein
VSSSRSRAHAAPSRSLRRDLPHGDHSFCGLPSPARRTRTATFYRSSRGRRRRAPRPLEALAAVVGGRSRALLLAALVGPARPRTDARLHACHGGWSARGPGRAPAQSVPPRSCIRGKQQSRSRYRVPMQGDSADYDVTPRDSPGAARKRWRRSLCRSPGRPCCFRRPGRRFGVVPSVRRAATSCTESRGGGWPARRKPAAHRETARRTEAVAASGVRGQVRGVELAASREARSRDRRGRLRFSSFAFLSRFSASATHSSPRTSARHASTPVTPACPVSRCTVRRPSWPCRVQPFWLNASCRCSVGPTASSDG